jgi:hypothetical protein
VSCNNHDDDLKNEVFRNYTGRYNIISYKANEEVDLNNDGISNKELLNEIDSFNDPVYGDLHIRPENNGNDNVRLIDFSFPKTEITFESLLHPEGEVSFISFGNLSFYEFEVNTFLLEEKQYIEYAYIDNVEANRTVYLESDLRIRDSVHLELKLKKEYYDFNEARWKVLNIDVLYEKADTLISGQSQ